MNDKMKKNINYILILAFGILLTTFLIIFGWNLFFATIADDLPSIYIKIYVVISIVLITALIWIWMVKIKKGIILAIISLLVSSMIGYTVIRNDINNVYEEGVYYVDNYRYEDAAKCFMNISFLDYKDNDDYINLCLAYLQYQNGKEQEGYKQLQKLDFKYLSNKQQKQIDNLIVEVEDKINEEVEELSKPIIDSNDKDDKADDKIKPYKEDEEEEDPYHAKDYATEEDFYDDHYDDFYDFEEAEEYFWEHQE